MTDKDVSFQDCHYYMERLVEQTMFGKGGLVREVVARVDYDSSPQKTRKSFGIVSWFYWSDLRRVDDADVSDEMENT